MRGRVGASPPNSCLIYLSPQGKMGIFSRRLDSSHLRKASLPKPAKDGLSKHIFLHEEWMVLMGKGSVGSPPLLLCWERTPPLLQDGKESFSSALTCWLPLSSQSRVTAPTPQMGCDRETDALQGCLCTQTPSPSLWLALVMLGSLYLTLIEVPLPYGALFLVVTCSGGHKV